MMVSSGAEIVSNNEECFGGTLGLLVRKEGDARVVYGLSYGSVFDFSDVFLLKNNETLGIVSKNDRKEPKEVLQLEKPSVSTQISWFKIAPNANISADLGFEKKISRVVSPEEVWGQKVLKLKGEKPHKVGYLNAYSSMAIIKNSLTKTNSTFYGVAQVTADLDENELFSCSGDAGALVCTPECEIVGLIIGEDDQRSYVAPLKEVFEKHNFVILDQVLAEQFNSKVRPEEDLISLCKKTPDLVVDHFIATQYELNRYFSAIGRNSGSELENFQKELSKEIYYLIGQERFQSNDSFLRSNFPWFFQMVMSIPRINKLENEYEYLETWEEFISYQDDPEDLPIFQKLENI